MGLEITPDFTEVVTVQPGLYNVRIVDVEGKLSKKNTQFLRWKLLIFGNADEKLNGKTLFHNTMTQGAGAGGLKKLLLATLDRADGQFDTDELMGKELTVTVAQGKDVDGNPSDFPEVKSVAPLKS